MIKYMNTHSHNYLSEALYQGLGNGSDLENFLHSELGISVADISFLNGSGNNDGENRYTRANCKSIIKTIYALRKLMIESGKKSYHAMGVVDVDLETGKGYRSEYTSDSVVAKTGTVAKAVTLAGIASTQQGNVYFAFIYKTPSIAYAGQARRAIKEDLIELIDQHGGPEKMDSNSPEGYDPFDRKNVVIITQENLDSVPLRQN
jgi:D-alanyl-D-alanine carboxypeptidase